MKRLIVLVASLGMVFGINTAFANPASAALVGYGHANAYFDAYGNVVSGSDPRRAVRVGVETRSDGIPGMADTNACMQILWGGIARVQIGRVQFVRTTDRFTEMNNLVNANSNGSLTVCADTTSVYKGAGSYSYYGIARELSFRRTDGVLITGMSVSSFSSPRQWTCC